MGYEIPYRIAVDSVFLVHFKHIHIFFSLATWTYLSGGALITDLITT